VYYNIQITVVAHAGFFKGSHRIGPQQIFIIFSAWIAKTAKLGYAGLISDQQYWLALPECRCRTDAADYRPEATAGQSKFNTTTSSTVYGRLGCIPVSFPRPTVWKWQCSVYGTVRLYALVQFL
jgi:hypothetical protein